MSTTDVPISKLTVREAYQVIVASLLWAILFISSVSACYSLMTTPFVLGPDALNRALDLVMYLVLPMLMISVRRAIRFGADPGLHMTTVMRTR